MRHFLKFGIFSLVCLFLIQCSNESAQKKSLITNYPGGNIKIDSVEGNTFFLRPDNRKTDTTKEFWFYWNFKVTNLSEGTYHFVFNHPHPLTTAGPAVSENGGKDWQFLFAGEKKDTNAFSYHFKNPSDTAWFAISIPYTEDDWEVFTQEKNIETNELCKSKKGRSIKYIDLGPDSAQYCMLFTARHHACEMSASYVLEGIIEEWLSNPWLQENTRLIAIPFMDIDGVEEGLQGKKQLPHDPNRDYMQDHYPSVKAFKDSIHGWVNGRFTVFIDLHAPWIKYGTNESLFFIEKQDSVSNQNLKSLRKILSQRNRSSLIFTEDDFIAFGESWNTKTIKESKKKRLLSSTQWVSLQDITGISTTLEVSYAVVHDHVITPDQLTVFGKLLGESLAVYFQK